MTPANRIITFDRMALAEFRRAWRKYARISQSLAQSFQTAFEAAVGIIEINPAQGAPYQRRFRWVKLGRFPYLLYYEELTPHRVIVHAVAHTSRRPGYWLRRTRP